MYSPSFACCSVVMVPTLAGAGRYRDGWSLYWLFGRRAKKLEKTLGKNSPTVKGLCACRCPGTEEKMPSSSVTKNKVLAGSADNRSYVRPSPDSGSRRAMSFDRNPLQRMGEAHTNRIDGFLKKPISALRFIPRRCGVPSVRLIPRDSQALISGFLRTRRKCDLLRRHQDP